MPSLAAGKSRKASRDSDRYRPSFVFSDERDPRHGFLNSRMEAAAESAACTIVNVEEVLRGWLAIIHRLRDVHRQPPAYFRLGQFFNVPKEDGLASDISYKDQYFWVANRRLSTLIAFALEIGQQKAASPEEAELVACLRREEEDVLFPGCGFDLGERFPTLTSKKFWAGIFYDVARNIFLRQLGNQEIDFWQASAICDAQLIARILTHAVREEEPNWMAFSEDVRLAEGFDGGQIDVRL